MAEWRNGGMAGMAVRQKEWQNSRMAEMATYVLFTVHTDDDDDADNDADDTLIFYSIEDKCNRDGMPCNVFVKGTDTSKDKRIKIPYLLLEGCRHCIIHHLFMTAFRFQYTA